LIATGENAVKKLGGKVVAFPQCPGKAYVASLLKNFEATTPTSQQDFLNALHQQRSIQMEATPMMATSIASVDGKTHIYFANFAGLKSGENAVPTPQTNVRIKTKGSARRLHVIPFMGTESCIKGARQGKSTTFTIPRIERGAIAWIE